MTNYKKMLELTRTTATKEDIKSWAYMNRVCVAELAYDEPFKPMYPSVRSFLGGENSMDEDENWERFLECEYVER